MTIVNGMRPIHPGEVLREEFMILLGLSANALAMAADTALRLAKRDSPSIKMIAFQRIVDDFAESSHATMLPCFNTLLLVDSPSPHATLAHLNGPLGF